MDSNSDMELSDDNFLPEMNDFVAKSIGDEATIAPEPLKSSGKQSSYLAQYVFVYKLSRQAQADSAAACWQCSPKG